MADIQDDFGVGEPSYEYHEPAYPCNDNMDHDGMSIRDRFASYVLQAMIANPDTHDLQDVRYFTKTAYRFADEMMKERVR